MHAIFAPLVALILLLPGGGWLGVYLSGEHQKAVVAEVIPGSPAQKAGLRAGDVLLLIDDTALPTREAAVAQIGKRSPGDRIRLLVHREGKNVVVEVKLGKRPSEFAITETAEPAPASKARGKGVPAGEAKVREIGIDTIAIDSIAINGKPFLGVSIGETDQGVVIERVLDRSPASKSKLRAGDTIRSVGDHKIRTLDDLDVALGGMKIGKPIPFGVQRGDARLMVVVVPGVAGKAVVPGISGVAIERPAPSKVTTRPAGIEIVEVLEMPPAELRARAKARRDVDKELAALRAELRELKKELRLLKKQLERQRK